MSAFRRTYDVHGLALHVEAQTAHLGERAENALGLFGASSPSQDAYLLRIGYGSAPAANQPLPGLRHIWDGEFPGGIRLACYVGDEARQTDLLGLGRIEIQFARREAQITIAPAAEWCLTRPCLVLTLCELLGRVGQSAVHAASLRVEQDGQHRAVLISGGSGFGKTTTSLALARAGMKLMGDDTCFVVRRDDRGQEELAVWGLLLASKVHVQTLQLMPWLNDFHRQRANTETEYLIDTRQALGVERSAPLKPGAIFFLEPRNDRDHRIAPLDKIDAVSRLTRENVRAADPASYARAAQTFRTLGQLARNCQTYCLSVGPHLESLHEQILTKLGW